MKEKYMGKIVYAGNIWGFVFKKDVFPLGKMTNDRIAVISKYHFLR